ncbi:MAG: 16S rRNA (adenine(1518)-N(6)/adenine(1519)-N(6))-dimethyltransferase RsmA [Candidatus Saccharimonadia bacterium]
MDLSEVDDLKIAMRLAGINAKKSLGQHFLVDKPSLIDIVASADVQASDTILEIGPGLGVMTTLLTEQADQVIAVEADPTLAMLLTRDAPKNLIVVSEDILKFDLTTLPTGYKVVANLPYYLSSKVLRLLLESPNPPRLMSLLLQKEVTERIIAKPGQMSVLALSVQYYATAEMIGVIERHKFWPPPKVDSAIIRITRRPEPAFAASTDQLFRLIIAGFGEKRKQLKNSLAGGLNVEINSIAKLLDKAQLPPQARAQELSLLDWQKLYTEALVSGLI